MPILEVEVKLREEDGVYSCPFRGSRSSCNLSCDAGINFCPTLVDDESARLAQPKACPLNVHTVVVRIGD